MSAGSFHGAENYGEYDENSEHQNVFASLGDHDYEARVSPLSREGSGGEPRSRPVTGTRGECIVSAPIRR